MQADMNRRTFLNAAAVLTGAPTYRTGARRRATRQGDPAWYRWRPRPKKTNMSSAQVIIVNDVLYLVDAATASRASS
jgi:hypothetical protein